MDNRSLYVMYLAGYQIQYTDFAGYLARYQDIRPSNKAGYPSYILLETW